MVMVDRHHDDARSVDAYTLGQALPWALVEEFSRLVDAVLDAVDVLIDEVRERLERQMHAIEVPSAMPPGFGLLKAPHTDFDARTRRRPYPSSQTLYWSIRDAQSPD